VLPKSNTHMRLLIEVLSASTPEWKEMLVKYIKPMIVKGVPSVINDLKSSIYKDSQKSKILGEVLL
jgi:hypothetical protein